MSYTRANCSLEVFEERAPTDDEVILIQEDLKDTPVAVASIIREHLAACSVSLDVWVPRSAWYYERLVGQWRATFRSTTMRRGRVSPIHRTFEMAGSRGLEAGSSSHSAALSKRRACRNENRRRYAPEVISWLADKGDAMFCAAGIEIALARLAGDDRLKEPLTRLLNIFVEGKPVANVDPIELLSWIFLAVYGEIAHCRIHAAKPPFWRKWRRWHKLRLSRDVSPTSDTTRPSWPDWLKSVRSQIYLLQCFVDAGRTSVAAGLWVSASAKKRDMGRVWSAATSTAGRVRT